MTPCPQVFFNGPLFDGAVLHEGMFARFEAGVLHHLGPLSEKPVDGQQIDLQGDILSPGYVDLQVNGGGGVMLNDDPSVETLQRMAQAHRRLGVVRFLPTLITDTPDKTRATIAAAREAIAKGVPGIAGLHLEGPHLSQARKGAHDGALIRPMEAADLDALLQAAGQLPCLKVTLAPENVTEAQVSALVQAGVLVSLGHSDADFATCQRYVAAGARCATHLFNAMSQLDKRAPGLVGAALGSGAVSAGLIADGVHVHPAVMRLAWAAKQGPGRLFLVSDAMAVAGTDDPGFELEGRRITRQDGQLRLSDGTLAGADLDLTRAVSVLVKEVGVDLAEALAAATSVPAKMIGLPCALRPGETRLADMIRLRADLSGLVA